jgi:hypothetical protein
LPEYDRLASDAFAFDKEAGGVSVIAHRHDPMIASCTVANSILQQRILACVRRQFHSAPAET